MPAPTERRIEVPPRGLHVQPFQHFAEQNRRVLEHQSDSDSSSGGSSSVTSATLSHVSRLWSQ